MAAPSPPREVRLQAADLPFACPPPDAPKWSLHPRVFIPLSASQPVHNCPYCGTKYLLRAEAKKEDGG